mgnify:CR=1 FL=1
MKFLKKWGTLLVAILMLAVIAVLCLVGLTSINKYKATIAKQQESIEAMRNTIDNDVGPLIDCYVVNQSVRVGDEITEENITATQIPEKIAYTTVMVDVETTDEKGKTVITQEPQKRISFVTNLNDVVGKKFRVGLDEGAILMTDFVRDETVGNTDRYYQLILNDYPTDIQVGDYVDIRIQFTYGEDFIAIPHQRVENVDLSRGLFTFIFNESNIVTYNSMLLDRAMYPTVSIYALKYVDSSSQVSAENYYPVNKNISEILAINPNIIDLVKEEMVLERDQLNSIMGGTFETFDDKRLSDVKKSIDDFRDDVVKDKRLNIKDRIKAEKDAAKAAAKANKG